MLPGCTLPLLSGERSSGQPKGWAGGQRHMGMTRSHVPVRSQVASGTGVRAWPLLSLHFGGSQRLSRRPPARMHLYVRGFSQLKIRLSQLQVTLSCLSNCTSLGNTPTLRSQSTAEARVFARMTAVLWGAWQKPGVQVCPRVLTFLQERPRAKATRFRESHSPDARRAAHGAEAPRACAGGPHPPQLRGLHSGLWEAPQHMHSL